MSVFSMIKRGRQQAREHNAKKAEKEKEEAVKLPYKHVVTHAASDALSGVPSSWKHDDKHRIMEQNKRRTAIMDGEANMAGMPRVGSSLTYGSFASVYATPVVPLPRNYSYNNIPTSWREQLANFQDDRSSFAHSGSVATSKGKEPEYVRSSSSTGPFASLSPGQSSTISSNGALFNSSSTNLSASDDDSELKEKIVNHRSQGLGYRPSLSQQSSSSSEKSYRTHLTSSGTTIEAPVKADRHYPPPAQSTYFSAPRPLARRTPVADTSIPPITAVAERTGSTASSSDASGQVYDPPSIASIGVAIAPPRLPLSVERPSPPPLTEDRVASQQRRNKIQTSTTTTTTTPIQAPRRFSMDQSKASTDIIAERPNRQTVPPAAPQAQKRRRRLSKSRPPSVTESETKMSIETVRPTRPNSTATPIASGFDFGQMGLAVQQKVEEPTVVVTSELVQKHPGKLSKRREARSNSKERWTFRLNPFGSKTPAIVAH